MKICLIHNLYKPYAIGGAERVVELIFSGLREAGQEAFIITTRPLFKNSAEEKKSVYYLRSFQFAFRSCPKFIRLFWHIFGLFNIFSYWRVRSILKKEKPDMVMTHSLIGIGFLLPRLISHLNIKHIHVLHDIQLLHPSGLIIYGQEGIVDSVRAKAYQVICAKLFASVDIVISPSNWLMQEHTKRGFFLNSCQEIILNPASVMKMPGRAESSGRFKLLYVGQLEAHKGVYFLLQAFHELAKNNDNFSLSVVGSGQAEGECRVIAAKTKNIVFLGKMTSEEVKKTMISSDSLVLPSLCYENSPTVMYEAARSGLPVIASRLGGISELAHIFGGLLFQPGDQADLIKKIIWASKNPSELKKITVKGARKINEYCATNYVRKILNIL